MLQRTWDQHMTPAASAMEGTFAEHESQPCATNLPPKDAYADIIVPAQRRRGLVRAAIYREYAMRVGT